MSVVVDRKDTASPYHGKAAHSHLSSMRNAATTAALKGTGEWERQKTNISKNTSAAGMNTAVSVLGYGNRTDAEQLNMMAVQRVDKHVFDLLSTVPQVVLYQYEADSNIWERTSTEGTLFIYTRDLSPRHGFVLLNRLSSDNLQEMIEVGSEYRVQGLFVLFKKQSGASGPIYGLCFSDTDICDRTGQLLNRLSQHDTVSTSNGHRTVTALSSSMRSHSVPALPHTQDVVVGEKMNILELLDNAGNPYHTQVFSDDTGSSSQESPPSDAISFTANPFTSSHPNEEGHPSIGDRNRSSPSSAKGHKGKDKTPVLKRSTPRTIPRLVNMNASTSPSKPPSSSPQSNASHHVHSHIQYSSRVVGSLPKSSSQNSQLLHSTSVTTASTSDAAHTPKQEMPTRTPLRAATAPSFVVGSNRRKQPPTRGGPPGFKHSNHLPSGPLQEVIPEQAPARKLFTLEETQRQRGSDGATAAVSSSVRLQKFFSQSLPAPLERAGTVPRGGTPFTTSIQPLSLAEIEKQMSEEVPSPDKLQQHFSLIPTLSPPPSSSSSPVTSSHSMSSTQSTNPSTLSTSAPDGRGVLLQPSSFSAITTTPPRIVTAPLINTHTGNGRGTGVTSSGMSLQGVLMRSSTTGSIEVNVEPPTPVVTTSSHTATYGGINGGDFPDNPPLMHSPGMRAPPVSQGALQEKEAVNKGSNDVASSKAARRKRGGKGGRRSPGKSRSPVGSEGSPSPQPGVALDVTDTPSRSWSVPSNMSPVSVVVPSGQPASQPHTLLSPQQFSDTPTTSTATHNPQYSGGVEQQSVQVPLSREHFKQALIHLIQNDEEFVSHLHHAYHLRVAQQLTQP